MLDTVAEALSPGGPLHALTAYRHFCVYEIRPKAGREYKSDKVPVLPKKWGTPANLLTADEAIMAAYSWQGAHPVGIGYLLQPTDPFFFVDVDTAVTDAGQWQPLVHELFQLLPGAAFEVSTSGRGCHFIGRCPDFPHSCRDDSLGLEFYTQNRLIALTGQSAVGDALAWLPLETAALGAKWFPPKDENTTAVDWVDEPVEEWEGPEDDDELIAKALKSSRKVDAAEVFGGKTKVRAEFHHLWEADVATLAAVYPTKEDKPYDASGADQALANALAFWTGKNPVRIERLMRRSALARDKWDSHTQYMTWTVENAVRDCTSVLGSGKKPLTELPAHIAPAIAGSRPPIDTRSHTLANTETPGLEPSAPAAATLPAGVPSWEEVASAQQPTGLAPLHRSGHQLLPPELQEQLFAGCVYIRDSNKIAIPDGTYLDSARFNVAYGGYEFQLNPAERKAVTTRAWDAFTQSQVLDWPTAHSVCFRPEEPPGALIEAEGWRLFNGFVPIHTKRIAGDIAPFLGLLERLLPDERDRRILLTWMARVVRSPGFKAQWWPVLQGAEGNGKTMLIQAMEFAVGSRYSYMPDMAKMAKKEGGFNAWVRNCLFIGMEEVYVQNRRDFLEAIKPWVTNTRLEIEGKGVDQYTGDNRANGMMTTNHRDGVPTNIDNRRYCVFFTAQQCAEDVEAAGMMGNYFPDLYDWFYGRRKWAEHGSNYGRAIINNYLHEYELCAEFDPMGGCQRAPQTSTSAEAREASQGKLEQEVLEAVQSGEPGFAGGWVSTTMLAKLCDRLRTYLPPSKRDKLLADLGYVKHPALADYGRTPNPVQPDGNKTRLYVKRGHLALNLQKPAEVSKAYSDAQQSGGVLAAAAAAFGNQ